MHAKNASGELTLHNHLKLKIISQEHRASQGGTTVSEDGTARPNASQNDCAGIYTRHRALK